MAEAVREEKRMAIKIGHASSDEERKAHGGKAGDQTGGEVCIREWYPSPWDTVLRFKDAAKAEKAAKAMEAACANDNIGYDQYQRNTLLAKAEAVEFDLAKVDEPCETDCSALVSVCAQAAGIDIPYTSGNAPWTGIMAAQFMSTGEFEELREAKYLTTDAHLKRGDILLRTSGHTAMALENGAETKQNIPSEWFEEDVDWAKANGIMLGDTNGNLRLKDYVTREEMTAFMHRLWDMLR